MRTTLLAAAAFGALLSSGCGLSQNTVGSSLDVSTVQEIERGRSGRGDVIRLLGPPDEIVYSNKEHDPLFERAFRYKRERAKRAVFFMVLFGTYRLDTKFDEVIVFFDENGIVEELGWRLDAEKARYGFPTS